MGKTCNLTFLKMQDHIDLGINLLQDNSHIKQTTILPRISTIHQLFREPPRLMKSQED